MTFNTKSLAICISVAFAIILLVDVSGAASAGGTSSRSRCVAATAQATKVPGGGSWVARLNLSTTAYWCFDGKDVTSYKISGCQAGTSGVTGSLWSPHDVHCRKVGYEKTMLSNGSYVGRPHAEARLRSRATFSALVNGSPLREGIAYDLIVDHNGCYATTATLGGPPGTWTCP
jgi:hypothetical protein